MSAALTDAVLSILVLQLGSDRWADRDRSHRILASLAPIAIHQLDAGTHHRDAEIAKRCQQLLAPFAQSRAEKTAFALRTHWPWLSMPCETAIEYDFLERARARWPEVVGGGPDFADWRLATKLWVVHRLLAGDPVMLIQYELTRMVADETAWKKIYAAPPPP